jgi:hypothetical protein
VVMKLVLVVCVTDSWREVTMAMKECSWNVCDWYSLNLVVFTHTAFLVTVLSPVVLKETVED